MLSLFRRRQDVADSRSPGAGLPVSRRFVHASKIGFHKALPWLSVLLLVSLILAPIGMLAWLALRTDMFAVQAVTVLDAREHTAYAAEAIVRRELVHVPWQRTIFFVDTSIIEQAVLSELPQVRTVLVRRSLPGTIKVLIQEKTPALLLLSSGDYFFVDSQGIPYEEARLETLPGVVLPTVKNNAPDTRVTLGVPAVAPEFVSFVQHIHEHLNEYIPAKSVEIRIPSLAAREVYFHLDNNWEIRFDVTRDPTVQLALLRRIVTEIIQEDERPLLEYIDLRITNRVYYKVRGQGDY